VPSSIRRRQHPQSRGEFLHRHFLRSLSIGAGTRYFQRIHLIVCRYDAACGTTLSEPVEFRAICDRSTCEQVANAGDDRFRVADCLGPGSGKSTVTHRRRHPANDMQDCVLAPCCFSTVISLMSKRNMRFRSRLRRRRVPQARQILRECQYFAFCSASPREPLLFKVGILLLRSSTINRLSFQRRSSVVATKRCEGSTSW